MRGYRHISHIVNDKTQKTPIYYVEDDNDGVHFDGDAVYIMLVIIIMLHDECGSL